jgi:hypothetical protein
VTAGSVEAVITSWVGATTMDVVTDTAWAGLLLSLTVAVKLEVPLAVGVPEIVPLDARFSPAGSLPEVIDHV